MTRKATPPSTASPPADAPRLRTIDELAPIIRRGKTWIYEAVRAGRLPHTRIGRQILFTDEHVDQIITAREHLTGDYGRRKNSPRRTPSAERRAG